MIFLGKKKMDFTMGINGTRLDFVGLDLDYDEFYGGVAFKR